MKRLPLYAALFTSLTFAMLWSAQAQDMDVDDMMAEIGELADEQKTNNEKIKIDLKANQETDRDVAANKQELDAARADNQQAISDAKSMISQYGGNTSGHTHTVNCGDDSGCSSQLDALNVRFQRFSSLVKAQKARRTTRSSASDNTKALRQRNRAISQRIATLRGLIAAARAAGAAKERGSCVTGCKNLTKDAASQCLQHCWSNARRHTSVPRVEQVVKPSFSMKPRRTAQQAIDEYKKSGAARPGPNSLRTRSIPPPSFN